jgi:hypothetical protein
MSKKVMAVVLLLLAIGVLVYWYVDGAHIYNVDRVQVETVDPLFGTKSVEWQDQFHPGLLGYIGPIVGVLVVASVALLVMARKGDRGRVTA